MIIGCNQTKCVRIVTCIGCLPSLGKSYASLGKGWVEGSDDQRENSQLKRIFSSKEKIINWRENSE